MKVGDVRIKVHAYGCRIEEIVTPDGLYIEWPELFNNVASAAEYLEGMGYKEMKSG